MKKSTFFLNRGSWVFVSCCLVSSYIVLFSSLTNKDGILLVNIIPTGVALLFTIFYFCVMSHDIYLRGYKQNDRDRLIKTYENWQIASRSGEVEIIDRYCPLQQDAIERVFLRWHYACVYCDEPDDQGSKVTIALKTKIKNYQGKTFEIRGGSLVLKGKEKIYN